MKYRHVPVPAGVAVRSLAAQQTWTDGGASGQAVAQPNCDQPR
jgi:hypothetical protein